MRNIKTGEEERRRAINSGGAFIPDSLSLVPSLRALLCCVFIPFHLQAAAADIVGSAITAISPEKEKERGGGVAERERERERENKS